MTYDLAAHRAFDRDGHLKLVAGGPGWYDYATHQAKALAKEDPVLHGDLPAQVAAAIQQSAPQRATPNPNRRT